MWRERIDINRGTTVRFDDFKTFVETPPTEGLGASLPILFNICREDKIALDRLDREVQRPVGVKLNADTDITNRNISGTPSPESQQGTLRTLRKNFPELHAAVLSGEMTIAEADKASGRRKRRVSIYLTSAESAAATIRNNATPEFIAELRRLLE